MPTEAASPSEREQERNDKNCPLAKGSRGRLFIAGCGIAVLPGADVLKVVQAIRDRMNELQRSFPPGVTAGPRYPEAQLRRLGI